MRLPRALVWSLLGRSPSAQYRQDIILQIERVKGLIRPMRTATLRLKMLSVLVPAVTRTRKRYLCCLTSASAVNCPLHIKGPLGLASFVLIGTNRGTGSSCFSVVPGMTVTSAPESSLKLILPPRMWITSLNAGSAASVQVMELRKTADISVTSCTLARVCWGKHMLAKWRCLRHLKHWARLAWHSLSGWLRPHLPQLLQSCCFWSCCFFMPCWCFFTFPGPLVSRCLLGTLSSACACSHLLEVWGALRLWHHSHLDKLWLSGRMDSILQADLRPQL